MLSINSPLWNHQKDAISEGIKGYFYALFHEAGTGKSRSTIEIIRRVYAREARLCRTVVFCPKIVCTNWKREIETFSKIHPRSITVLNGSGAKRLKAFREAAFSSSGDQLDHVFITNFEAVEMDSLFSAFIDWGIEVIVLDEAHRIKNPESKRAKSIIQLGDKAKYRYALTGTPVLNSPMDIFNIYRFMDKGETFGRNFWKFRNTWFEDENAEWSGKPGYFPKYVPRPEVFAEFNEMIKKSSSRVLKSECLDLPPLVQKEIFIEYSPEQKRLYEEMKKEYIAYVDTLEESGEPRAVIAQLAVTRALRLLQIGTGYAKLDTGEIYKIKQNPRLDALEDLLEELTPNHKVIVWSVFHENYEDIAGVCRKLGVDYAELHGKVPEKQRDANIKRFETDPKCRVFIANQGAGGIGINLVASDIAIYYSQGYSLEQRLQSEARNYRGGSEKHSKVTWIDLVAPGTMDEIISNALRNKLDVATRILDIRKSL